MRRFFTIIALTLLSTIALAQAAQQGTQGTVQEAQGTQDAMQGAQQLPTEGVQGLAAEQSADLAAEQSQGLQMKPSPNNPEALWDAAAAAYNGGDYDTAIEYYTTILSGDRHSADLYYNLANAYFKREQIALALLNYNRALRLRPGDEDIRHNLEYAEQSTRDSIEEIPEFFLSTWVRGLRSLLSGNAWTILSLVLLALTLTMALLFLLAQRLSMRKVGFYAMGVLGVLFLLATSFAWSDRTEATQRREAIIMSSSVSIKSSPDSTSTELFVLHEGTRVRVGEVMDGWAEVRIADGRKGWIEIDRIERI